MHTASQTAMLIRRVDQTGYPARLLMLGAYGTAVDGSPDPAELAAAAIGIWGHRSINAATHIVAAGNSIRYTGGLFPRVQTVAVQIDREGRANWYAVPPTPIVHHGGSSGAGRVVLHITTPADANSLMVAAALRVRSQASRLGAHLGWQTVEHRPGRNPAFLQPGVDRILQHTLTIQEPIQGTGAAALLNTLR